jgi:hypothetical protein
MKLKSLSVRPLLVRPGGVLRTPQTRTTSVPGRTESRTEPDGFADFLEKTRGVAGQGPDNTRTGAQDSRTRAGQWHLEEGPA